MNAHKLRWRAMHYVIGDVHNDAGWKEKTAVFGIGEKGILTEKKYREML